MASVKGARRKIKSTCIDIINLSLNASSCLSLLAIRMNFLKFSFKKMELYLIVINLKSEYSIFGVSKSFSGLEIRPILTLSSPPGYILSDARLQMELGRGGAR